MGGWLMARGLRLIIGLRTAKQQEATNAVEDCVEEHVGTVDGMQSLM